jgi:hypothetical protein
MSLRSYVNPPIQYFVDREQWLHCYVALFQHNLKQDSDRNQGAPIIVCYTNAECDSLNRECRDLIFDHPTETYVRNELLVFRNCYRVRRLKTNDSGVKISYSVSFFTSEPVLVIDSSQSELTLPSFTWKMVLGSLDSFRDGISQWVTRKAPTQHVDYLIAQLMAIVGEWSWKDDGITLSTGRTLLDAHLNGLSKTINRLPRHYWIDTIGLDSQDKIDPNDVSPEPIQIIAIAQISLDVYTAECEKIRSLIKTLVTSSHHFHMPKLLLDYLIQKIWTWYYRIHVWPFAEVAYGYAITTHKSQGSTYTHVFVNISNILGCRKVSSLVRMKSLYTAMTRASRSINLLHRTSCLYSLANETQCFTCQICHRRQLSKQFPIINHQIDKECANHILALVNPVHLYLRDDDVVLSDKNKNLYVIPNHELADRHVNDAYDYVSSHLLLRNEIECYRHSNLHLIQQLRPVRT